MYNRDMNENKNKQLINLACDHERDLGLTSHFYYFLVGWMGNDHHEEMAIAARRWLESYAPEKLADFDKNLLDLTLSV